MTHFAALRGLLRTCRACARGGLGGGLSQTCNAPKETEIQSKLHLTYAGGPGRQEGLVDAPAWASWRARAVTQAAIRGAAVSMSASRKGEH